MNKSPERFNKNSYLKTGYFLSFLGLIAFISRFSAEPETKLDVLKRAKGKCESCKKFVDDMNLLCSHLDHTRNEHYNDPNKLKAYCIGCEAKHHINHVGKAHEIGLNERDNVTAAYGWWLTIKRSEDLELIIDIIYNYEVQFKKMLKKIRKRKNTYMKLTELYPKTQTKI